MKGKFKWTILPVGQSHSYLSWSNGVHLPPWRHGDGSHGTYSASQSLPVYPGSQTQVYDPWVLKHRPWWQGPEPLEHSTTSSVHRVPVKPGGHAQEYPAAVVLSATQRPPLRQGWDAQWSSCEHSGPVEEEIIVIDDIFGVVIDKN